MSYYIACGIEAEYKAAEDKSPDAAKKAEWKKLYDAACALYSQGKFADALDGSNKALEAAKKLLGETHPDVAITFDQQARIYTAMKQYSKAEKSFAQAEGVLLKAFAIKGTDPMALNKESVKYPGVPSILIHRAGLFLMRGMLREADLSLKWIVNMLEAHKPYSPEMSDALYLFAEMHRNQKLFDKADMYYKRALNIRENAPMTVSMDYGKILVGIAANYHTQKKYKESEIYYRKALAIFEELRGPASKEAKLIRVNLALIYETQGLHADAVKMRLDNE
jgi:tetratricopeptide (TPR) repeat protein